MKRIRRYYDNLGIANKIFATLLMVSITPILVIELIIGHMDYTILQRKSNELINSTMVITKNSLENYFTNYENVMMSIYTRNTFAGYLENLNSWNTLYYYKDKNALMKELENIVYDNPEILGIAIITNKKELIRYEQVNLPKNKSLCFPREDQTIESLFMETKYNAGMIYSDAVKRNYADGSVEQVIYIAHRVMNMDKYSKGALGSIILCIKERDIAKIYGEAVDDTNLTIICDRKGNIISASNTQFVGRNIYGETKIDKRSLNENEEKSDVFAKIDKQEVHTAVAKFLDENMDDGYSKMIIYEKIFLDEKFCVINVQDSRTLLADINYLMLMIILIGVIVVLFSLLISFHFYDTTKESVQNIISGMNRTHEGDLSVHIQSDRKDEFGLIAMHFNEMVERINESRQLEKQGLIRRKNAEIKALEAQINPHFLYNTLDAINWVAIEKEQFMISKMLRDLGIILRYSVHESNAVVTLNKELEYLKKYIHLQQMRFEYAFDYNIAIDETLLYCKIHKLLFQPLIENSIVHGFKGKKGDKILIEIIPKGKSELKIIVSDNGKGMPSKVLSELQDFDYQMGDIKTSIGLRNVFQRVKYYYGDRSSYSIDSNENGTCVILTIPVKM